MEKMKKEETIQGWCSHHWNNMPGNLENFEVVLGEKPDCPAKYWNTEQPSNCKWHPFTIVVAENCEAAIERGNGDFWALSLYGEGLPENGVLITNGNGRGPDLKKIKIPRHIIVSSDGTALEEVAIIEKLKEQGFDWKESGVRSPWGAVA